MLSRVNIPSITVAGVAVPVRSGPVANLGSMFDPHLTLSAHVTKTVKMANLHLRNIGRVRKMFTEGTARQLVQSLVVSRLNYCYSLLCGIPNMLMDKLQKSQNMAARIVTCTRVPSHITPVLRDLQ